VLKFVNPVLRGVAVGWLVQMTLRSRWKPRSANWSRWRPVHSRRAVASLMKSGKLSKLTGSSLS